MFIIAFPINDAHRRLYHTLQQVISYMYSFVHDKSKEGDLYLVDNVEYEIILSPE